MYSMDLQTYHLSFQLNSSPFYCPGSVVFTIINRRLAAPSKIQCVYLLLSWSTCLRDMNMSLPAPSTSLAESSTADQILAGCASIQMPAHTGNCLSHWWTPPDGELWSTSESTIRSIGCITITDCPPFCLSLVSDWAFQMLPRACNSLPQQVTSAYPLTVFRARLKTHLISLSFPQLQSASTVFCTL